MINRRSAKRHGIRTLFILGWILALLIVGSAGAIAQQGSATAAEPDAEEFAPGEAASDQGEIRLFNEYIAIIVNATEENTGRFAVETTGGDPDRVGDEVSPLIYRIPNQLPWTSYTTVRIDGIDYVFGGEPTERAGRAGLFGEQLVAPRIVDDRMIETVYRIGPLAVTQLLSIIRSSTTGLLDTARIEYRVENLSSESHQVGLRIMLDTMLGANDGAPFRVEELAIVSDTAFFGTQIPQFWQAFDSLSDPKVTAQGTFQGDDVTAPDRVYFTNWGAVADGLWDFSFEAGRSFTRLGEFQLDSAMALYWDPIALGPGESRSYVTHYGLGGISISPGQLSIGVTSPATVTGAPDELVTFPIVAYIQNTGEGDARDVVARLRLPQGLVAAPGESLTRDLGHLPPGRTSQVTWRVALDRTVGGELTYSVRVEAINAEPNEVSRSVRIVSPAALSITIENRDGRLRIVDGRWHPVPYEVRAVVENTGGADAGGVWVRWESPIGLELSPGDRAEKPVGPLLAGERATMIWHIEPSIKPYPFIGNLAYSVKGRMLSHAQEFRADAYLDVPPLDGQVRFVPELGESGAVRVGDYLLVRVVAENIRNFYGADIVVRFDPTALQLVGGSLGVDAGRIFTEVEPGDSGGASTGTFNLLRWERPRYTSAQGVATVRFGGDRRGAAQPTLHWATDTIATLRLKALKPGVHALTFDEVRVFDQDNQGVKAQPINVQFTVTEE